MSEDAELSKMYTNHSIRVTATTYLGRKDFSPKQIMAITGHRSLNSLSIYQKVSTDEKLMMAYAMSSYLTMDMPLKQIPAPQEPTKAALPSMAMRSTTTKPTPPPHSDALHKENTTAALVPFESEDPFGDDELQDFDLGNILETIEKENTFAMTQSTAGNMTNIMQHQTVQKKITTNPDIQQLQNRKYQHYYQQELTKLSISVVKSKKSC